jgi:hypothetical protein
MTSGPPPTTQHPKRTCYAERTYTMEKRLLGTLEGSAMNIQAADVTLTGEEVAEIDARSAQVTVAGARGSGHETYR